MSLVWCINDEQEQQQEQQQNETINGSHRRHRWCGGQRHFHRGLLSRRRLEDVATNHDDDIVDVCFVRTWRGGRLRSAAD